MRPTHPSIITPKAKRRPRFRPPSADGLSMKTLSTQTLIVLTCTFLVATGSQAAEPVIRSKQQAPADLQAVFTLQDDTESRAPSEGLKLARRTLMPSVGIDQSLLVNSFQKENPGLALMAMDRFPSSAEWTDWAANGLSYVQYVGRKHWLVQLTGDVPALFKTTGALAFIEYRPSDKVAPALDDFSKHQAFFNSERYLIVLSVGLIPQADQGLADRLRKEFHQSGVEHVDESGVHRVTLVTDPSNLDRLMAMPQVLSIEPGAWEIQVLMDGVRAVSRGDNVVGGDGQLLTGKNIRAATRETLGTNEGVDHLHEAFMEHNVLGGIPTPRLSSTALATSCWSGTSSHGMMTAGVLLGNGWFSDLYSGGNLGYRGLAPEATYECYHQPGAHAHVSSHSYVTSHPNGTVVGAESAEKHHAHVIALGNSGQTDPYNCGSGYFSVCNPQKNFLGVGNAQVNGEIYAGSSAGPTDDGRIKPDISAPTGQTNATIVAGGFTVEVSRIQIIRGGTSLFDWNFLYATAEGWGQTVSSIGRSGVDVVPLHGRIQMEVEEKVPGQPWGGWGGTPVVGTEVDAFGNPLNFVGQEGDLLRVHYRADDLDYFDMIPVWFRDHPYVSPDCFAGPDPSACPWYSQSLHGGIGIGDGQWRTMEVPIGTSGDWDTGTHLFWDDEETWADESIQFLGFRFKSNQKQPAPSYPQYYNGGSGGTSGASPVLGGAYALAMENLTRLYRNVDLDQRLYPSVYYAGSSPSFVTGMPLNSTWKALFVHTADDMIRTFAGPETPPNPDTGVPNVYHAGPDYTTGYGLVDIQSAINLMNMKADAEPLFEVIEFELQENDWHTYDLPVSDAFVAGDLGLKVTLVWDDSPTQNSLVNNLSLILQAPDGTKYYPWSLDVPALPVTAAGIVPAQRNQPNDRDNIEQVLVDDVAKSDSGTWQIHVTESGMGDPLFDQKYSLVVSPWNVENQCHTCD